MRAISNNLANDILNFDLLSEEDLYKAVKLIDKAAKELRASEESYYKLVPWPDSQSLMEHPRFNECLLVDEIEGHDHYWIGSAYMCPIDLYEEIFSA